MADGVIETYAIGGAVGATFLVEPIATQDIGGFVAFKPVSDRLMVSLQPIYDYLSQAGATTVRGQTGLKFDIERVTQSKSARRRRLADLPFAEKLRILESLRERDSILQSGRNTPISAPKFPSDPDSDQTPVKS